MKDIEVAQSIVPLGKFKAQAARYLRELAESDRPLVLTQNGHSAAVLLSPVEYDRIRERYLFLESIAAGLSDAEAGRVMDTEALRDLLREHRGGRGTE
jgi:prevent-host-death family protein